MDVIDSARVRPYGLKGASGARVLCLVGLHLDVRGRLMSSLGRQWSMISIVDFRKDWGEGMLMGFKNAEAFSRFVVRMGFDLEAFFDKILSTGHHQYTVRRKLIHKGIPEYPCPNVPLKFMALSSARDGWL